MKRSFHFDVGDSTQGPLGLCLRVTAENEEAAVAAANAFLGDLGELHIPVDQLTDDVEYAAVYFNPKGALSIEHIDDCEDLDDSDNDDTDDESDDDTDDDSDDESDGDVDAHDFLWRHRSWRSNVLISGE